MQAWRRFVRRCYSSAALAAKRRIRLLRWQRAHDRHLLIDDKYVTVPRPLSFTLRACDHLHTPRHHTHACALVPPPPLRPSGISLCHFPVLSTQPVTHATSLTHRHPCSHCIDNSGQKDTLSLLNGWSLVPNTKTTTFASSGPPVCVPHLRSTIPSELFLYKHAVREGWRVYKRDTVQWVQSRPAAARKAVKEFLRRRRVKAAKEVSVERVNDWMSLAATV